MQKQYISLGNKDVYNGQYLLSVFHIIPNRENLLSAASEVASESSTGSNLEIGTATSFSKSMNALVYKIDEQKNLVYIAYPWRIFDRGGNIQNIVTFIAGNIYGMANLKACKLLDVHFPSQMLTQYDGPSYTIDDMRKYLNIYDRPILGTIIKPKIGLTPSEYAELCYDFWSGGGDFVKNDEPQADQDFSPYTKMVDNVHEAMNRAEDETGHTKIHSFNVSAADLDTMLRRADYIINVMKQGSFAFLVDGLTAGWTSVQTIRRHYPNVFLHFHRAGHGAFTRRENPFGYSVLVLTKLARLAGTSGIHTGTACVGKMAGSEEDIIAAQMALRIKANGYYFDQIWSEVPENDPDIKQTIQQEKEIWDAGALVLSRKRKEKELENEPVKWRGINKTCPIASGGLNPTKFAEFIEKIGTVDFITTMGAGVHSHPGGTKSGVKAILQAYNAWHEGVNLRDYAIDHEELKQAIEFFKVKN